jgi:uncharacterized protein YcaQ
MRLSAPAARTLHLAAQGLCERPSGPAGKAEVLAAIRTMGLLQIDTISVVARSPYLVLWSRLGSYDPRWLDELLAEGALFEYWAHAACFLPIEEFGLYRWRMRELADGDSQEKAETRLRVLAHIQERGAVRALEFPRDGGTSQGWWDWKPEKQALEHLFNTGVLMIARREGFQRVYDLTERVLPGWDDTSAPAREEACRLLLLKALRALGVTPLSWLADYFPNMLRGPTARRSLQGLLAELTREGQAVPVAVDGWSQPAYVHRDNLDLAEQARAGTLRPSVTTLLSPFDPVVSNRARALEIFGFHYRIETYTPAPKRRYGYYSLPILHHGVLVGRLDAKAHRKQKLFEVKTLHLEPDVAVSAELVSSLAEALRECALWHGTPEVVVRESDPPSLCFQLQAALA